MSKNVAVFVDVANIFYAAKAAGVDIDYVTLLKAAVSGRDFVRAYAYTGLDPENENQRNFHSFLARHGYKVVSKDIRKYGDGKVKANLDIELVVDMMKTARNLDVAIVISGDGDFAPAIRAVQEMGVRVEVISFRGNTSSDLIEVADVFTDIVQIARVDRDSARSGRRVAGDEEDLSMTEVPDKQTEGTGRRRRRGRGAERGPERGRPAAVVRAVEAPETPAAAALGGATAAGPARMVVLPGEKLSRAQSGEAEAEPVEELVEEEALGPEQAAGDGERPDEAGHRRRRRGGRGRGRGGRGRDDLEPVAEEAAAAATEEGELPELPAAAAPPRSTFGSVWDSQIGMVGGPTQLSPLPPEDEDYAEPEIPEYLLAERRRGQRNQRGQRGARSAYASAMERERFGRVNRYPESAPRQPQAQPQRRREERPPQQRRQSQPVRQPQQARQPRGSEPWSEVPPELEEMLRAQLATKLTRPGGEETGRPESAAPQSTAPAPSELPAEEASQVSAIDQAEVERSGAVPASVAEVPTPATGRGRGRGRRPASQVAPAEAAVASEQVPEVAEAPTPRRRGGRRAAATAPSASAPVETSPETPAQASTAAGPAAEQAEAAPTRRRRRTSTAAQPAAEAAAEAQAESAPEAAEPVRRRRAPARRKSEPDQVAADASNATASEAPETPRPRRTRRRATPAGEETGQAGGE